MGLNVLIRLVDQVKSSQPSWYSIIADEATDTSCNEQFNLPLQWVDDNYGVHKESVGLFQLPSANAVM